MLVRDRRLRLLCLGAIAWAIVAFVSALQGQVFAAYRGRPQEWGPTLGYTAAIFSVWALLTPGILKASDRIFAARPRAPILIILWISGYPLATMLHLAIFVGLFWPVYGTQMPTPLAMASAVFAANVDKSIFAYAGLIAVSLVRRRMRERAQVNESAALPPTGDGGLWIRVAGGSHLVRFDEIDWIAAAGDYAEVHMNGRSLLTDRSLAALAGQLPEKEFARIHRGSIVRLDRVRAVRSLGRGDAGILLCTGKTLRLSRRYRANLAAHLPV